MDFLELGEGTQTVRPMLLVLAAVAAMAVGIWLARRQRTNLWYPLGTILFVGISSARLSFIMVYQEMYVSAPWTILDLRDGGFNYVVGMLGAVIMTILLAVRRRRWRLPLLATLLSGTVLWGAVAAIPSLQGKSVPLPDIVLSDLNGKAVPIASLAGTPVVVNLWATWCPPCRREMPILRDAQQENRDIVFVFANQGEPVEKVNAYLASEGLALENILMDTTGALAKKLGAAGLPTTFYFDAKGNLFDTTVGGVSHATLAQQIQSLRNGH